MNQDLTIQLKNHRKNNTPFKQLVFKQLDNHGAFTTRELYEKVSSEMDKTTFYRIIKQFYELNVVKDVVIDGRRKVELSDGYTSHHHHMICVRCGDIINISDIKLEQYLKLLAARKGYQHLNHSFEIQGTCPACSLKYRQLAQQSAAVNDDLGTSHIAGHVGSKE